MTDKIILNDVATFDNSMLNVINANNAALRTSIDDQLSRDGTTPNQMGDALDMNSYPILNLPAPGSPNSPARLVDVTTTNPINISLSLSGDVNAPASSGTLTTTVNKIKNNPLGATTPTAGNMLIADGTQWNSVTPSGAFTVNSSGVSALGSNTVSSSNLTSGAVGLSNITNIAANSVIGNNTGSSATPTALTETQLTAMVQPFSSSLSGAAPSSGGGTTNFLRADGTWALPPSAQTYQLLNSAVISSSTNFTDTTSITSSYSFYDVHISSLIPVVSNSFLILRVYVASTLQSASYSTIWFGTDQVNLFNQVSTALASGVPLTGIQSSINAMANTAIGWNGTIRFYNPSAVSGHPNIMTEGMYTNVGGNITWSKSIGSWTGGTGAINGFQIISSGGNLSSGLIKVYGIA